MKLQLLIFLVFFVLIFSTSLTSSSFSIYSGPILVQTTKELLQQSLPIFRNVSAVNTNNTVGINNNIIVSPAFINPNSSDETVFQGGIHYISVVCPIRSPAVVLPVSDSTIFDAENPNSNLTKLVDGILYCQIIKTSDINSTKSINEQLIDAKLATLDNSSRKCNNETFTYSLSDRETDC
jgi:hypothetical protein